VLVQSSARQLERTRAYAEKFLEQMRGELQRAASAGHDSPPRLRSIHERPGHATPEFRTLVIPVPPGVAQLSPQILSATIAYFAAKRAPDRLLLGMDAVHSDERGVTRPVLILEARDQVGTRLFWMQAYQLENGSIRWMEPLTGGWLNPGDRQMILDAAFPPTAAQGDARVVLSPKPVP
jgi:hypothetical protein